MPKMPRTTELFDLTRTIAAPLLASCEYPDEALPKIRDFILALGPALSPEEYETRGENVWIAKSATVAESACICGPTIICAGSEIRHCAYIRGCVIVGEGSVVGNSTELKNAILFDCVQVPHFNYVGDSIYGYRSHTGAGTIASNVRSDKKNVIVHTEDGAYDTKLRKMGAMLGDGCEVGCNSVLCPGSIVGRNSIV